MVGAIIMLVLRRFVLPASSMSRPIQRMRALESVTLSEATSAHLVEVDGKSYVVIESTRQAVVQAVQATPRAQARVGPPWLQRLYKVESR
jgi:flagellar biogenesis protein FliO